MRILRHLLAWLRRDRLDDDLREELAQHREWTAERLVAEGVPEAEARRRAAVAIGNPIRLRERARGIWGFPSVDSVLQDARYGIRQMRRSPIFSAVAILSLAVAIGAATAVFSLADVVLLRTMAVRDPGSLYVIRWWSGPVFPFNSLDGYGGQTSNGLGSTSFSRAAYESFRRDAAHDLDVVGFADLYQVAAAVEGRTELAPAHAVSGNYFAVLGVAPALGRAIEEDDDRIEAAPAAVISDRFWRRRFEAAADVLGRTIFIDRVPFTVVGVAPPAFHGTGQVGTDPDVFVPLALRSRVVADGDPPDDANFWWVLMLGRVKPGIRLEQARTTLNVLLKRTVQLAKPALTSADLPVIELVPGGRGQVEERDGMRDPLRTMTWVTAIVLLVACANVAGLLLARGRARLRELAVRMAIGAPRRRVLRQLLIEALIVGLAGCALGLVAAYWIGAALAPALSTGPQPPGLLLHVDQRVLAFSLVLACGCAAIFGIVPSLRATDFRASAALQEAGRGTVGGGGRRLLSAGLVVTQMALSLLLIVGAALLVRSVGNLNRVDLGFDPGNLLLFRVDPASSGYDAPRASDLYARLLERLRATPGVTAASLSSHQLISNSSAIGVVSRLDEAVPPPGSAAMAEFSRSHRAWQLGIDERFFDTMRMRVARGRVFTAADAGGAAVVVVNRSLARQLFGTDDVVGRQLDTGSEKQRHGSAEIVGVVEDARYTSMRGAKPPTMYTYYRQPPGLKNAPTFEVRTSGAPSALAGSVRDIVREIDPALPVYGVVSQTDQIALSLRQERLFARLATLLGAVALMLSAIGLYGLLAYGVAQRTPEIGVRMALGAGRERVLWMVMRESLVLALVGLLAGVPAALLGTRVLQSMLFGLAPRDPVTLTAAAVAMLLVAALAGYIPARRAARVDPMTALRLD